MDNPGASAGRKGAKTSRDANAASAARRAASPAAAAAAAGAGGGGGAGAPVIWDPNYQQIKIELQPGAKEDGRKIIAMYNYKGGVGKTTSCINLAVAMAKLGHRVLLVDADPQCNMTGYLRADGESPIRMMEEEARKEAEEEEEEDSSDEASKGGGGKRKATDDEEDDGAGLRLKVATFPLYPNTIAHMGVAARVMTALDRFPSIYTAIKPAFNGRALGEIKTFQVFNDDAEFLVLKDKIHLLRGDPRLNEYNSVLEGSRALTGAQAELKIKMFGAFRR